MTAAELQLSLQTILYKQRFNCYCLVTCHLISFVANKQLSISFKCLPYAGYCICKKWAFVVNLCSVDGTICTFGAEHFSCILGYHRELRQCLWHLR